VISFFIRAILYNRNLYFLILVLKISDLILLMSFHQRDEIRWNKKGYFERFDGKKYWRKLCVIEGCMKRAKVLNWCKRVSDIVFLSR
jgi:hypothetical protein